MINQTFAQSLRLKRVFNYLIGKDITNKLQQIAVLHKENQEKAAAIISAASITNTGDNWNQGTSNRRPSMASVASIAAIRSMPGSRRESGSSYRSNRSSICGGQPRSRRGSSIHGDLFWWKNQQPQSQLLPNNKYEIPVGHKSATRSCSIDISPLVGNTPGPGSILSRIASGRPITPEYVTIGINKSRRASVSAGARLGVGYGSGNQIHHRPLSPGHHPVSPMHQMTVSSPNRRGAGGSFGGGKYVMTAAGQMSVGGGTRRRSSLSTTAAANALAPGPLNAGQHTGSMIPALMVPSRIVDTSRKEDIMDLEQGDFSQGRNESTSHQPSSSSSSSSFAHPSSAPRSSSTVGHSTSSHQCSTVIGQIQDQRSQLLLPSENLSNLPQIKVISASIHSQNWINELIDPKLIDPSVSSSADYGESDNKPSTTNYDSGNYANEQTCTSYGSTSRSVRSASMPSGSSGKSPGESSSQVGQTVVTEQRSSGQAGTSGSESEMRTNQEEENCFLMQLPDRFIDDDEEDGDGKYSDEEEDSTPCLDRGRTLRSNLLL